MGDPQAQTVNIKRIGINDGFRSARTGFIPCETGFTAEVRILTPYHRSFDEVDYWTGNHVFLITDQIPFW